MCGRYELHSHPAAIALAFGLASTPSVYPRYNIAPMTEIPIVRVNAEGQRELVQLRWGLVPRWAKDPSIGARMINARGETIADKPSFQMPYRRHRCLLPADGFYEWQAPPARPGAGEAARKRPSISGWPTAALRPCRTLRALAQRRWEGARHLHDRDDPANALLAPIHDRMPLIVARQHYTRWLDPANDDVGDLIVPFPPEAMAHYPVSPRVNNVRHDDAAVLDRVDPAAAESGAEHEPPRLPGAGIAVLIPSAEHGAAGDRRRQLPDRSRSCKARPGAAHGSAHRDPRHRNRA
jgi:putative SOS response-associated peptidase YedK